MLPLSHYNKSILNKLFMILYKHLYHNEYSQTNLSKNMNAPSPYIIIARAGNDSLEKK